MDWTISRAWPTGPWEHPILIVEPPALHSDLQSVTPPQRPGHRYAQVRCCPESSSVSGDVFSQASGVGNISDRNARIGAVAALYSSGSEGQLSLMQMNIGLRTRIDLKNGVASLALRGPRRIYCMLCLSQYKVKGLFCRSESE